MKEGKGTFALLVFAVVLSMLSVLLAYFRHNSNRAANGVGASTASAPVTTTPRSSNRRAWSTVRVPQSLKLSTCATVLSRDGSGTVYTASCPRHADAQGFATHSAALSWDIETGYAHCFGCGWGGQFTQALALTDPFSLPANITLVFKR